MSWLLFTLAAPLASFGRAGPLETRGSAPMPTRSALLGLVGGALGIRRDDTAALDALADSVRFACRVEQPGRLLRDYHTVQTPSQSLLKKAPHKTRRDELAFPSADLNTVLSTREYHEDFRATIGIHADADALGRCAHALERPRFVPYLGRKACVTSWPFAPRIVDDESWEVALATFDALREHDAERWRKAVGRSRLRWPLPANSDRQHAIESGLANFVADRSQWRETIERDAPRDRMRWLFAPNAWLQRTEPGERP